MNHDHADLLRSLAREVADLQRQTAGLPVRPAEVFDASLIGGTADELIAPGVAGAVDGIDCVNTTGHPVWAGSQVWLDPSGRFILATNAANLLAGDWDGVGLKADVESYDLADDSSTGTPGVAVNKRHYDDAGVLDAAISIVDPAGLLTAVTSDDPTVFFATGDDAGGVTFTVIGTKVGGSGGGGGFTWPGPGAGPTAGSATVTICKALVNQSGGVAVGASVPWDGGVEVIGTVVASGTATNPGCVFADNEPIYVISTNAAGWFAVKMGVNIIRAQVNQANGVRPANTTFPFDTTSAIVGIAPASGTATNTDASFQDNQQIYLVQRNDGMWHPFLVPPQASLFRTISTISAAAWSGTELTIGSGTAQRFVMKTGSSSIYVLPAGTHTIRNSATTAVSPGKNIQCKMIDGFWFVDVEDCA